MPSRGRSRRVCRGQIRNQSAIQAWDRGRLGNALCERLGVAKLGPLDDLTELQYGVLLRGRWVVDRDICDLKSVEQGTWRVSSSRVREARRASSRCGRAQRGTRSACSRGTSLHTHRSNCISLPGSDAPLSGCADSPTWSLPLKTYMRQLLTGFLASGGSLYLRTTPWKVLVSAASAPEGAKLGSIVLTGTTAPGPSSPSTFAAD